MAATKYATPIQSKDAIKKSSTNLTRECIYVPWTDPKLKYLYRLYK